MSVIIIPTGLPYIKKEDAPKGFKNHLINIIIAGLGWIICNTILVTMLYGRLLTFSETIPLTREFLFIGTLFFLIGPVVYWILIIPSFSREYKASFLNKLKKYDAKEMINFNQLVDLKRQWIGFGIYALTLMIGIGLYLLPLVLATNS